MEMTESSPEDEQTIISTTDSSYIVTCTVSIALAIFKEHEEYLANSEKRKKETKKDASSEVVEAPRAEGYYCIEYNMKPDDPEPTRVDLVMFGLAAKLYMANETKVLKPWREGNQVWVSWSQTLKLNVTRELLIKMASHKITVRVWDSKDKVSFKARNDRPKAFRLPQERSGEDPDQMGGIRKIVCEMRAIYKKENLRTRSSMKNCTDLVPADYRKRLEACCVTVPSKSGITIEKSQTSPTKKTLFQKPTQDIAELVEVKPEKEAASLELSFAPLLAGSMTLTDRLGFCSGGVKEGFWNITLNQPLITEQLKAELNPLVITLSSASSLPSSPVPFHVLKAKCLPVYCQYKFHNMPVYRTKGHEHDANINFKDVNVIFTGLLSPGKLFEFLRGPPMKIEVHDRDRKNEKPSRTAAIFGTDPSDAKEDLWGTRNALKADTELHDSYGIAKLDFSDLLRGCRYLKLKLPIRSSSSEVPSDVAMPVGHYLEADAQLKVQVEIANTLHPENSNSKEDCPFGRIIYVFNYNNIPVLAKLTSEILQINAVAFQLNRYPEETIQRVLSGHKITAKDGENKRLNVLTGFHMMDKALHLFVLEGLKDQAVRRLWTTVPMKLDGDEEEQVTVLYNSDLSFSERLYDTLDMGLSPVCLVKPLENILMEPLVFIRNTVPHACLEAMKRISHICQAKKLQEVVHHDLFPSADMVQSLSEEFGLDLGREELWLVTETQQSQDIPDHHNIRKRTYTPLDNFNREYFQWKRNEGKNMKDFIQDSTCIRFSYPGFKSSIESNQHPKRPDDARIEELKKPIPVISVVQPSEKTGSAEREANIPFAPGLFQNHSLSWDKNAIPRYSSQFSKFHFRDYWRPHSFLHKRSVLPLTDQEKSIHSFQKPAEAPKTPKITANFKHSRNIIEMRTNKDITLHVN
ncbi:putative protein KIAA1257-like [Labeo rohita]|uniref:DUF4550 domain-containing protein n=1 Tax=Labeo rohita TaxID=84645 RepID=A0A498MJA2_LABRO|nr:putative protein KIAA1257-like [Labeo rohita]